MMASTLPSQELLYFSKWCNAQIQLWVEFLVCDICSKCVSTWHSYVSSCRKWFVWFTRQNFLSASNAGWICLNRLIWLTTMHCPISKWLYMFCPIQPSVATRRKWGIKHSVTRTWYQVSIWEIWCYVPHVLANIFMTGSSHCFWKCNMRLRLQILV